MNRTVKNLARNGLLCAMLSVSVYAVAATAWKEGVTYNAGTVVTYNGKDYTALVTHTAYVGTNWNPAATPTLWSATGGTSSPNPTPAPQPTPAPGGGSCSGATWQSGVNYSLGTVVNYNGSYYKVVNVGSNGSDGTDPTISTWYWQKTTCTGGTNPTPAPTPKPATPTPAPASCPAWQRGTNYSLGTVVNYNGSFYKVVNTGTNGSDGTDPTISTWYWQPSSCSGSGGGTPNPTPVPGGGGNGFVVSEAQFNQMFPGRNSFYTYQGLVNALSAYPAFANTGSDTTRKQEAAAFLANIGHETGGLVYIEEIAKGEYCDRGAWGAPYPCAPGKRYYGRGPMQLSWNPNYALAGAALGLNLLADPDLVARDATVAWKTGIWYWMTQTGPGTMTPHAGIVGGSFGETIRSINGALECGGRNPAQVQSRITSYLYFTNILGVTSGSNTGC
ncbi:hypothetical protein IGB42_02361 [Andreprevotia sp. IGB-42]|uniref:glycoside hydrolase family 19 protein n=1 Tax=Andreprevotia sp. IGB-42 TaxID=2497473 RepID=UPI00157E4092|nr:glycoside hydrolase family 19 protein [Andreprevotia sp. IGB-42]KAF0812966.1 hypothetical protein IGB42_02361 [Andreprevotia sp. IGB-42]